MQAGAAAERVDRVCAGVSLICAARASASGLCDLCGAATTVRVRSRDRRKNFFRSVHIESRPAYIFTEISVQTAAYGFPIAPASFRLKRNVRVFAFVRGYNAAQACGGARVR